MLAVGTVILGFLIDCSKSPSTSWITTSFLVVGSTTFLLDAALAALILSDSLPDAAFDASAFWRLSLWESSVASFCIVGTWVD